MTTPVPILILSSGGSGWAVDGMLYSMKMFWRDLFTSTMDEPCFVSGMNGGWFAPDIFVATDEYGGLLDARHKGKSLFDIDGLGNPGRVHDMRWSRAPERKLTLIEQKGRVPFDKWNSRFFVPTVQHLVDVGYTNAFVLLDDYWLVREVDPSVVTLLRPSVPYADWILKIDLANDVLYSGGGGRYLYGNETRDHYGHYDLIEKDRGAEYFFSLWGGIWNLPLLLDLISEFAARGLESPHQLEIEGTPMAREIHKETLVLGTRQAPLLHANVIQQGRVIVGNNGPQLSEMTLEMMKKVGVLMGPGK